MKDLILVVLLASVAVTSLFIAGNEMIVELHETKLEGECIAKYIAAGHERINIATVNGTCHIEENGYYK